MTRPVGDKAQETFEIPGKKNRPHYPGPLYQGQTNPDTDEPPVETSPSVGGNTPDPAPSTPNPDGQAKSPTKPDQNTQKVVWYRQLRTRLGASTFISQFNMRNYKEGSEDTSYDHSSDGLPPFMLEVMYPNLFSNGRLTLDIGLRYSQASYQGNDIDPSRVSEFDFKRFDAVLQGRVKLHENFQPVVRLSTGYGQISADGNPLDLGGAEINDGTRGVAIDDNPSLVAGKDWGADYGYALGGIFPIRKGIELFLFYEQTWNQVSIGHDELPNNTVIPNNETTVVNRTVWLGAGMSFDIFGGGKSGGPDKAKDKPIDDALDAEPINDALDGPQGDDGAPDTNNNAGKAGDSAGADGEPE